MITIKIISTGETHSPLINTFYFRDKVDEIIFYNNTKMINQKLAKGMKININETLVIFCSHIFNGINTGMPVKEIEITAYKILSPKDVMIGVPELMRKTIFEVECDNMDKEHIILHEPITIERYILAEGWS